MVGGIVSLALSHTQSKANPRLKSVPFQVFLPISKLFLRTMDIGFQCYEISAGNKK